MSGILPSGRALARGWEQFIWGLEAALRKSEAGVMMWAKHKSHGDLVDAQPCADGRGMGGRCDGKREGQDHAEALGPSRTSG